MRKTAAVTQKEKPVFNFSFIHYSDKVLFHAIVRGFTISMLQISKELNSKKIQFVKTVTNRNKKC